MESAQVGDLIRQILGTFDATGFTAAELDTLTKSTYTFLTSSSFSSTGEGVCDTKLLQLSDNTSNTTNRSSVVLDNLQFVGVKFFKLAASSFAYQSFPSADTEKLTALVAHCVSMEHLSKFAAEHKFDRDIHVYMLVGYTSIVLGPQAAARYLIPHFQAIVEFSKQALDIPQIIGYLRPGTLLQGKSREERIAIVADELRLRGVDVRPPREVESEEDFIPVAYQVEIYRTHSKVAAHGDEGDTLETRLTFSSLKEAQEAVLVRARTFIQEARAFAKANAASAASNTGDVAEQPKRRYLTIDEVDGAQAAAYGHFVMHTVRRILRFDSPFDLMLQKLGRYVDCIDSGGWVPLIDIVDVLQEHHKSTCSVIEPPTAEFVSRLLEDHDGMQRFEIGTCSVAGSPLSGLSCARALYAHQGHVEGGLPLYKTILDSWPRAASPCPASGWILMDKKGIKNFATKGYKLFDNNVLVTVVQPCHLLAFERYLRRAVLPEVTTPYSARCMLDEKIRSPLFFVEVFLGAAAEDSQMITKQHPPRGDCPGHHILVPNGHRYIKKSKGVDHRYFPIKLLSGRTVEIFSTNVTQSPTTSQEHQDPQSSVRIVHGRVAFPDDAFVTFAPGELETLLEKGGARLISAEEESELQLVTTAKQQQTQLDSGGDATAASAATEAPAAMVCVRLDDTAIREDVSRFHDDPQRVMMEVEIPRSHGQTTYFERTKVMGELKKWFMSLGLTYQEVSSGRAGVEVLLLRKPQVFPEHIIDGILSETSFGDFRDRSLLRRAITRECVDRENNYERLEFIGDAILDYVVVRDAFSLFGSCGRKSILQVAVDVCRNEVLCELIPVVLQEHLTQQFGEKNIAMKTKADMMEAMIGAVFEDRHGLGGVRRFSAALFRKLPRQLEHATVRGNAELRFKLQNAIRLCPYLMSRRSHSSAGEQNADAVDLLESDETLFASVFINCFDVTSVPSLEQRPQSDGRNGTTSPPALKTWQSHKASTGFPRIQDKDFATHFTTGNVYSYRRLTPEHLPQLKNRVLKLFHSGEIGFVNETLRNVTRVTFDIDGISFRSLGLLQRIVEWFRLGYFRQYLPSSDDRLSDVPKEETPRYRGSCCSMGIVLDCSGMSVVSKKYKHSCHIHFPQVVCTIEQLRSMTQSLRCFIVRNFLVNERRCCFGTGKVLVVSCSHASSGTVTSLLGRVALDMKLVCARFDELAMIFSDDSPKRCTVRPGRHFLHPEILATAMLSYLDHGQIFSAVECKPVVAMMEYLSINDLLLRLQPLSRMHYHAVNIFLRNAAFFRPSLLLRVIYGSDESPVVASTLSRTEKLDTLEPTAPLPPSLAQFHLSWREMIEDVAIATAAAATGTGAAGRLPLLCDAIVLRCMRPPMTSFAHGTFLLLSHRLEMLKGRVSCDAAAEVSCEKTLTAFCERNAHLFKKKSTKSKEFYDAVVRPLQEQSKYDLPFWMKTIDQGLVESKKLRWYLNDKWDTVYQQEYRPLVADTLLRPSLEADDECLVPARHGAPNNAQIPHGALLELTSLHSPQFFDSYGNASSLLDESIFFQDDDNGDQGEVPRPRMTTGPKHEAATLPTFESCCATPPIQISDWQLWISGVFSTSVIRAEANSQQKPQRHGALFPAWLQHSRDSLGNNVCQFVIGGHVYLSAGAADMSQSASGLMARINRILTPHIDVRAEWKFPPLFNDERFPLFTETRGGGGRTVAAVPISGVAVSQQGSTTTTVPRIPSGPLSAVLSETLHAAATTTPLDITPSSGAEWSSNTQSTMPLDHWLRPSVTHNQPSTTSADSLVIPRQRCEHITFRGMGGGLMIPVGAPCSETAPSIDTIVEWCLLSLPNVGQHPVLVVVPSTGSELNAWRTASRRGCSWIVARNLSGVSPVWVDNKRFSYVLYLGSNAPKEFSRVIDVCGNPATVFCLFESGLNEILKSKSMSWR